MRYQRSAKLLHALLVVSALLALLALVVPAVGAASAKGQKSFASAGDAVSALVAALRANDHQELAAIFGPGSQQIVASGDPVADQANRERFLKRYDEKHDIRESAPGKMLLSVGNDDYPFPVPLVGKDGSWRFDAQAGKEELLNRRIGRNELEVIDVLYAYVEAQREYAQEDRSGEGTLQFAQKIRSTAGKKDGLYWAVKEGEPESPFGPLAAKATREGYLKNKGESPSPYHGYLFKILKGQGAHADGGAFDYVVNGKMVLGFALVAYPARYGTSGIMTFVVNQQGVVYQKNLGKETGKLAEKMKLYDPDSSWKKVQ